MKHRLLILLILACCQMQAQTFAPIDPTNIDIVRDKWGVPHIYGKTDAEAAYGLAWANAEDAYEVMQELLIMGKGKSGIHQGKSGAEIDFFRHVIQAEAIVKQELPNMPDDFLKYIDGYVQGANAYAAKFPEEVAVKNLFPITINDALVSYVVAMSAMTDASGALSSIYNGSVEKDTVMGLGSNAFAASSSKTIDGETYLCINPHLQMIGAFSFYEAHINSEEGLNVHGALFPGGTSVFMGANEHLGWGMTWNHFERGDTYKLKMHPKKKLMYEYDGQWLKLEKKKIWLKVKLGKVVIPVPKTSYMSVMGPTVKVPKTDSYYAFRYPAFMDISAPLQWYKMDKATNYTEFKAALDLVGVSLFNLVYADKEDNILYASIGQVPLRSDALANAKVLNGSNSKNVWQRIRTFDELPQLKNPLSGYVYNTNNTPFLCTAPSYSIDKSLFPKHLDTRPGQNNRAEVMSHFFESHEKISFEQFQAIKFDNSYSRDAYVTQHLMPYLTMDFSAHPDIEDYLTKMANWDMVADSLDENAACFMVAMDKIFKAKGYGDKQFILGLDISEEDFITGVRQAKAWFLKYYGTIDVGLGEIFKAKKGEMVVTSPGYPDALAANYGKEKNGKYYLEYGDTYTQFVRFNKDGIVEMRTQVPFGNSYDPESPYYFNQAGLFRDQQTKKMTLNRNEIYENAVEIYHPL